MAEKSIQVPPPTESFIENYKTLIPHPLDSQICLLGPCEFVAEEDFIHPFLFNQEVEEVPCIVTLILVLTEAPNIRTRQWQPKGETHSDEKNGIFELNASMMISGENSTPMR